MHHHAPLLPDDFHWQRTDLIRPTVTSTRFLCCGKTVVAFVDQKLNGDWYTTVNRHLDVPKWRKADCGSVEQGMRWVERWAAARVDRLRGQ